MKVWRSEQFKRTEPYWPHKQNSCMYTNYYFQSRLQLKAYFKSLFNTTLFLNSYIYSVCDSEGRTRLPLFACPFTSLTYCYFLYNIIFYTKRKISEFSHNDIWCSRPLHSNLKWRIFCKKKSSISCKILIIKTE